MFIKHRLLYKRSLDMSTPVHIDSSPLYGRSVSRQLTGAFVTQWKSSHPDGKVLDRDLNQPRFFPMVGEAEHLGGTHSV
jgi:FMN-dependent NADH-azoreductase